MSGEKHLKQYNLKKM